MKREFQPYLLFMFILLLMYVSFVIVRGMLSAIIWACVFAYIFTPLYKKLHKKIKRKSVASILVCALIVVAIFLPLVPLVSILGNQLVSSYVYVTEDGALDKLPDYISTDVNLNSYIKQSINKVVLFLVSEISDFILSIPAKLINFFVFMFLLFYLLIDGQKFVEQIHSLIPLPENYKDKLFAEATIGTRAILYGVIVSALAQGLAGTIGLFATGVPNALFWGFIMTFFSLIPFIGAWIIWLPASIWLVVTGHQVQGVALLIYGTIFVSSIDNIVRSKVIGTKAQVHPAIIFLGLIGGIKVFGLVGIVVGPLALSFLVSTLKLYRDSTIT